MVQFYELEKIMSQRGITTLADIARALDTTSQAVSNWKHSNHVPSHIITKLEEITFDGNLPVENSKSSISNTLGQPTPPPYIGNADPAFDGETISFLKISSTIAEQLKIIVLVAFIATFLVATYVQFIQQHKYHSSASVYLSSLNLSSLNLSSFSPPNLTLYPDLLRSQVFTERIMDREFYTDKFKKKLPLLAILTHGDMPSELGRSALVQQATDTLNGKYLKISQGKTPEVLIVSITASEPIFARELVEAILAEIEIFHRSFAEDSLNARHKVLQGQVAVAKRNIGKARQLVGQFSEQHDQILTPLLQQEYDILAFELKKRQQEHSKLKDKQWELGYTKSVSLQGSVMDVIKRPKTSCSSFNEDLKRKTLLAGVFGVGLGVLLGFVRSNLLNQYNNDPEAFKGLICLIKKKPKGVLLDWRVSGIIGLFLLAGLPYYLGCKSDVPVFFGRYSTNLMIVNTIYIVVTITFICLPIYNYRRSRR